MTTSVFQFIFDNVTGIAIKKGQNWSATHLTCRTYHLSKYKVALAAIGLEFDIYQKSQSDLDC